MLLRASLLALLVLGFMPGVGQQSPPTATAPPPPRPAPVVESKEGLVVSSSDIASDLGASILAKGGNAVDAAVATAFALAVTHPTAGNLGGGGFMVVRTTDGRATTFDYREKAPGKSTSTMYLGEDGNIVAART